MNFYKREYKKLNVSETINISDEDLFESTQLLFDYIKDKTDDLNLNVSINGINQEMFNEKEKLHMIDVKNLYLTSILVRNIMVVCIIIFLLFFNKTGVSFNYIKNTFINLIKIISLFVFSLIFYAFIDFERFWINFHYLFFDNELFFLDPSVDRLIMMVPQQFFVDLVSKITLHYIVLIGFFIVILKWRFKND